MLEEKRKAGERRSKLMPTDDETNRVFIQEGEFYGWAKEKLSGFDELIVASRTPMIFFSEEASSGVAKEYLHTLEDRLEQGHLRTTYYMSEKELSKRIFTPGDSIPSRVRSLTTWQRIWTSKRNVRPRVVHDGCFPLASFWIGRVAGKNGRERRYGGQYTFIKLRFEDDDKAAPVWLRIVGEIPGFGSILERLEEDSVPFEDYMTERLGDLGSLEP